MTTQNHGGLEPVHPALVTGVWALPLFGALLTVSTLTQQPDYRSDFASYSEYITTPWFLASHLVASVLGAGIGVVGLMSLAVLVAARHHRPGLVMTGAALGVVAHALNTAVFGVAAFAQPAIGRAHQSGANDVVAFNDDVYGPELIATVVLAFLLWLASAAITGRAIRSVHPSLRAAGTAYAVTLPLFYLAGPAIGVLQPVFGAMFTTAALVIARRIRMATATPAMELSRPAPRSRGPESPDVR